jgi:hypothetical protein
VFLRDHKKAMAFELGLAKYGERCVVVVVVVFLSMEFTSVMAELSHQRQSQTLTLVNEKILLF